MRASVLALLLSLTGCDDKGGKYVLGAYKEAVANCDGELAGPLFGAGYRKLLLRCELDDVVAGLKETGGGEPFLGFADLDANMLIVVRADTGNVFAVTSAEDGQDEFIRWLDKRLWYVCLRD